MELKSISEIRNCDESSMVSYARGIVAANNTHMTEAELISLFSEIRKPYYVIPAPEFVVMYLLSFMAEHYDNLDFRVVKVTDLNILSDSNLWLVQWIIGATARSLIINEESQSIITSTLDSIGEGNMPDILVENSIALLESDSSKMNDYRELLRSLSLIYDVEEVVPEPSATLEVDESTARFSSAIWYEKIQEKTIILAGLGGIGSYVAFLLGRMHPRALFLYDDDTVERVNLAGQLYSAHNVGFFKVDAIARTLASFSSYSSVFAVRERFTESTNPTDIMICGFDNMAARTIFFNSWLAHVETKIEEDKKHCLFIDGRLAAEELQVLCIRGDDDYNIQRYKDNFLFSDEEADETLCSYKQTTYMANMIGSIMVNLFTNFVANEIEENLRDLPFFTSYTADSMLFKTEQ